MNKTRRKHKLHWRVDYYSTVDRHCTIAVSPGVRSYVASYYCTLGIQCVLSGYIIILRFSPVYRFHQNNANFHYLLAEGSVQKRKRGVFDLSSLKKHIYLTQMNKDIQLISSIKFIGKRKVKPRTVSCVLIKHSNHRCMTLWKGRKVNNVAISWCVLWYKAQLVEHSTDAATQSCSLRERMNSEIGNFNTFNHHQHPEALLLLV